MEDNRNFGNQDRGRGDRDRGHDRNHDRGHDRNRFRHGGGNRHHGQQGRGGRPQRPLLTSSLNGAGLTLVALVLIDKMQQPIAHMYLSYAVIAFVVSAMVSYFAQRMRPVFIEKISDLFFFVGAGMILWVAGILGHLF